MSYQVIARKWRPQSLDELVGQEHVVDSLHNLIQSGRIAHAYLFSGPRGVGKTSVARILAKLLICEKGPTFNPCQVCSGCTEVASGQSYDVLEIDGASNRGIDEIRQLRDSLQYRPGGSRYRIFIIDEVHMLTDAAFNALLKSLEEPPEHVIFIFATTEPYKVKWTIRSRCQHYHFKRISMTVLQNQIQKILESEKVEIEQKALYQIAKSADGSMRDAQSLLEQLIIYCNSKITVNELEELLGWVPDEYCQQFLTKLSQRDLIGLMKLSSNLFEQDLDIFYFMYQLVEYAKNALLIQRSYKESALLSLSQDSIDFLKKQNLNLTEQEWVRLVHQLIVLSQSLKKSSHPQHEFESFLFAWIHAEQLITPNQILDKIDKLQQQVLQNTDQFHVTKSAKTVSCPSKAVVNTSDKSSVNKDKVSIIKKANPPEKPKASRPTVCGPFVLSYSEWNRFLDKMQDESWALRVSLSGVKPRLLESKLNLITNQEITYEELSQRKVIDQIKKIFSELFQLKMLIEIIYNQQLYDQFSWTKNKVVTKPKESSKLDDQIMDLFDGTIVDASD